MTDKISERQRRVWRLRDAIQVLEGCVRELAAEQALELAPLQVGDLLQDRRHWKWRITALVAGATANDHKIYWLYRIERGGLKPETQLVQDGEIGEGLRYTVFQLQPRELAEAG